MNKDILNAWDKNQNNVREWIATVNNSDFSYEMLLQNTIRILFEESEYDYHIPDHKRITMINNGEYQGTLVFVIGGQGYQPGVEDHWYTSVDYGSCSGCDTLQAISVYSNDLPNKKQIQQYWTLCLHMMQKMRRMKNEES